MSHASQVRAAVARSQARGRVAIIIADNLKTHTAEGSLLVRRMLTELSDQLSLVSTPADDPEHNHHRRDFEALLADARRHFETLTRTPDDLLRHIGSPFASDKRPPQSQTLAA